MAFAFRNSFIGCLRTFMQYINYIYMYICVYIYNIYIFLYAWASSRTFFRGGANSRDNQGWFHHWGCWGCIPLHQLCLLIWSNNINGHARATSKHLVPPMQYSDMALIMLVKFKTKSKT